MVYEFITFGRTTDPANYETSLFSHNGMVPRPGMLYPEFY